MAVLLLQSLLLELRQLLKLSVLRLLLQLKLLGLPMLLAPVQEVAEEL